MPMAVFSVVCCCVVWVMVALKGMLVVAVVGVEVEGGVRVVGTVFV